MSNLSLKLNLLLFFLVGISCQASTILLNPDFEGDDLSAWERTAITGIRAWSVGTALPQSGSRYLFTNDDSIITQNFSPILGSNVAEFSFWLDRPAFLTLSISLEFFYTSGVSSGQIVIPRDLNAGYEQIDVLPLIDTSRGLTGFSLTKAGPGTVRIDNFALSTIPEPSVFLMSIIGMMNLLSCRKRQV